MENKKKIGIDLGCGPFRKLARWGLDKNKSKYTDIIADLSKEFPFKNNSVDYFIASNILEHLPNPIDTMNRIWRCLRIGGTLTVEVPTTDGPAAWQDPQHVSYWNSYSWQYYSDDAMREMNPDIKCKFSIEDILLRIDDPIEGIPNPNVMMLALLCKVPI